MAYASFDRNFVVKDKAAADKLRRDLSSKNPVKTSNRDLSDDREKGIAILKRYSGMVCGKTSGD